MNLYEHALNELKILEDNCKDSDELNMQKVIDNNILELIKIFSNQGHTGATASYVISILNRLLEYKPLTPLTGEEDEWEDISKYQNNTPGWQNKRCPSIFKNEKGAYWVEGKIFSNDNGKSWYTSSDSCVPVEFPFTVPDKSEIVINNAENCENK